MVPKAGLTPTGLPTTHLKEPDTDEPTHLKEPDTDEWSDYSI